ncbi:MAG TPA: DegT/DnrJ/EryC1/StrS family aminotransferase [Candidatus Nanoarchaeia archaeon]|nr:DegT/DnrJ/EryC1/StrS family aminotransferase [Candidatus Nanoarchaeia archaeon]
MTNISWWRISFGEQEIKKIRESIEGEHISQGAVTEQFEREVAQQLGMPYALATTSGSIALLLSLMAHDIGPGDEVIVPNRTWIATANAPHILGAKVVLSDVLPDEPSMDMDDVEKKITSRTKAIIPVHLNGRSCDMRKLNSIAKANNIKIIEDACQALFSRNSGGYMGTQSEVGCFSFATTKMISTAQGGMIVTHDEKLYKKMKLLRWHGAGDNIHPVYRMASCNFKFTDIQASLGLVQLSQKKEKIHHMIELYKMYREGLENIPSVKLIEVDISQEIPIYVEVLAQKKQQLTEYLMSNSIQARPALPNVSSAPYLKCSDNFPNSDRFEQQGLFLPSGPAQPFENVETVLKALRAWA